VAPLVHISHGGKQDFGTAAEPEILFLKIYPRSKPGDDSLSSNPARIGIVLNHRLDQEWSIVQQHV
jgi:hypothetical protein